MKNHEFVASLLIVGIFGFTVGKDQTGSQNGLNSIAARRQPRFQRYVDFHMREKCERYGGPTVYEDSNIGDRKEIFMSCVQTLVNLTEFETEMSDARRDNEQGAVIAKYCLRVPAFEQCIENIAESIAPCLEPWERESVVILFGITKSLLKFACNDGKREVKDFVAAGGSRCVATKYSSVQNCADRSFSSIHYNAIDIPGVGVLPDLSLNVTGCNDIEEYRRCSVNVLTECDDPAVARVVDGLFEFIKGETSCKEVLSVIPDGVTESTDLEMETLEEAADDSPEMITYRQ